MDVCICTNECRPGRYEWPRPSTWFPRQRCYFKGSRMKIEAMYTANPTHPCHPLPPTPTPLPQLGTPSSILAIKDVWNLQAGISLHSETALRHRSTPVPSRCTRKLGTYVFSDILLLRGNAADHPDPYREGKMEAKCGLLIATGFNWDLELLQLHFRTSTQLHKVQEILKFRIRHENSNEN